MDWADNTREDTQNGMRNTKKQRKMHLSQHHEQPTAFNELEEEKKTETFATLRTIHVRNVDSRYQL